MQLLKEKGNMVPSCKRIWWSSRAF